MSLDVYLESEEAETRCVCGECGHEHSMSHRVEFFRGNITHNLSQMASEVPIGSHGGRPRATLYAYLWRATEPMETCAQTRSPVALAPAVVSWSGEGGLGISRAREMVGPLREGLSILRSDREQLLAFQPENGWGSYEGLVAFVGSYLTACEVFPDAIVRVWR